MENFSEEKLLFDIKNSDITIENDYCPHIFDHFVNSYMNSKLKRMTTETEEASLNNKHINNKIIYFQNLSLFQNSYKSFYYYGYNQSKNLLNNFFLKNISLDWVILNNPQNLSINSMNREGCIFSMSFNDTGNLMASSNHYHTIEIWDMKQRKIKEIISSHSEIVTGVEFFHKKEDNEYFLSCSLDKTIKLWKNYKNIHTFLEHSDWVRCISIREDNQQFLSGCVSSVVKLWDIPTQRVIGSIINQNSDPTSLTTVNSLNFMNNNPNLFIIGLRSGEVKIFDCRIQNKNDNYIKNVGIVQSFKAHQKKLNTAKLNKSDKYILTSGRDSLLRLWDIRKLPKENEINQKYIYEYNKHKCVGYNIECNFYLNENYIITGSEDGNIYIYDILNNKNYYKLKTLLKCINLIKQIPNTNYIAFTGLEDISIFIWNAHKNIIKFYEKYCNKNNKNDDNLVEDIEAEKDIEIEETDKGQQFCNKIIEEIMAECGDSILKIFHNHNMTYSNGINLENLSEIIQKSQDEKSANILKSITDKFMKKMMDNLLSIENNSKNKEKKGKVKKKEKKKIIKKRDIKCLECSQNDNNSNNNKVIENGNNIFNSINRNQLNDLLNLPNYYGFNKLNEN
jgi:WD40 repeat protein